MVVVEEGRLRQQFTSGYDSRKIEKDGILILLAGFRKKIRFLAQLPKHLRRIEPSKAQNQKDTSCFFLSKVSPRGEFLQRSSKGAPFTVDPSCCVISP